MMKKYEELSEEEKQELEKNCREAEQSVNEIGQQLVDQGLLEEAPLSLTESIRRKIAEAQQEQAKEK